MKTFRTLDLALEFYDQTQTIKVTGNLKTQLDRAASSISLNLAEGNAKSSVHDKRGFFQTAYGSFRECQVVLRLLKVSDPQILETANKLGGCLYKLINSEIKNSPNFRKPASDNRYPIPPNGNRHSV